MSEDPVRHCPGCGQALRFPENVGGMLMACPECGHRFASPFRLAATTGGPAPFPAPPTVSVPQHGPSPSPAKNPTLPNTLAARVAALYASKA